MSVQHTTTPSALPRAAWGLLGLALLAHLVLFPGTGYEQDIYNFGTWMHTAQAYGVTEVGRRVNFDYPPGYTYILRGFAWLWGFVTSAALPPVGSLVEHFVNSLQVVSAYFNVKIMI